LQRRVGAVEERLDPGERITSEQKAALQNRVKALAHLLTEHDPGKNHYQGIWGELNRRMGIAPYHDLRQSQYDAAIRFLEAWQQSLAGNHSA
jgi:hypothetical protein